MEDPPFYLWKFPPVKTIICEAILKPYIGGYDHGMVYLWTR